VRTLKRVVFLAFATTVTWTVGLAAWERFPPGTCNVAFIDSTCYPDDQIPDLQTREALCSSPALEECDEACLDVNDGSSQCGLHTTSSQGDGTPLLVACKNNQSGVRTGCHCQCEQDGEIE
jgi:hypothetical protein